MSVEYQDRLVRYLLGDLPRQEQECFEEEYFTSDEAWEALNAAEDDLINSYVRGELSPLQREQFERHFLASAKDCERVELAKILLNSAVRRRVGMLDDRQAPAAPSWIGTSTLKWVSAAAGVAAAVLAVFLLGQNHRLRIEIDDFQKQRAELQRQNTQLQQHIAALTKTTGPEVATISLVLTPGLLRDTGPENQNNVLKLPAKAALVKLLLDLRRDEYSEYDVALRTVEGKEIQQIAGLKSEPGAHGGRVVALSLPLRLLLPGDYIIRLYGQNAQNKMETLTPYSLSVIR